MPSYEMDRIPRGSDLIWAPRPKYQSVPKKRSKRREYDAVFMDYRQNPPRLTVCKFPNESLYDKFKRLLNEWQEDSMLMSSVTDMVMLRSYQAIIGMGPDVVPMILNELKYNPDYLFWALEAVTEINPVFPGDEGNLKRMAKAWIEWGRKEGIIE